MICGRECCNVAGPPFCASYRTSKVGHVAPLIGCLFLVFCAWFFPHTRFGRVLGVRKPMLFFLKDSSPTSSPSFVQEDDPEAVFRNPGKLRKSLEQLWSTSSLSKLQSGRSTLGTVAIGSFVEHTTRFDFQEQSCLNQFEHLISLWRSNCSLVADDQLQGDGDVYNSDLLLHGLDSMHAELLEDFQRWRRKFHYDADPPDEVDRVREITAYLLVWGEAGNLRFMPEIICFLTRAVCTSAPTGDFYGGHTPCQSHLFLPCQQLRLEDHGLFSFRSGCHAEQGKHAELSLDATVSRLRQAGVLGDILSVGNLEGLLFGRQWVGVPSSSF